METDDLSHIPDHISLRFFPSKITFSQKSLEKGLNYYTQGYIHNVRVRSSDALPVVVTARCWCSMRKSRPAHQLSLDINTDKITDSYCSCKAGLSGHCSHLVGLVKTLQAFKLHNYDRIPNEQSSTSVPQQWHIPRGKKIHPIPITQAILARPKEIRKRKPIFCHNDPHTKLPKITEDDLSVLKGLHGTPLEYIQNPPTPAPTTDTPLGPVQLGSLLSYQTQHILGSQDQVQTSNTVTKCGNTNFPQNASIPLNPEFDTLNNENQVTNPQKLENDTQRQAASDLWFDARSTRLTASNFGKVYFRQSKPSDAFIKSLFPPRKANKSETVKSSNVDSHTHNPMEYGKRHESDAKAKYLQVHPTRHIHECGLVVNNAYSFLGATPDAKVCDNGECGIIEIKCPFTARNMYLKDACQKVNKFYLKQSEDKSLSLKSDHMYYAQVQGQLMITGASFCDFAVFTQKDFFVQRVYPDDDFLQKLLLKLCDCYKKYCAPFLEKTKSES